MDSSFREQKSWWRKKWLENYLLILTPQIERNLLVKVCFLRSSYRSTTALSTRLWKMQLFGGLFVLFVCFKQTMFWFVLTLPLIFIVKCQQRVLKAFVYLPPAWWTLFLFCCPPGTPVLEKLLRKCCFHFLYAAEWDRALSPLCNRSQVGDSSLPTSVPGYLSYFTTTLSQKY